MNTLTKKYIAEVIGTFILVFFGCGTAIVTGDIVAIALAFGISIIVAAYTVGTISGAHLNPAVSFAMFCDGKMKTNEFVGYVLSQIVGSILASGFLAILVKCGALGIGWNDDKEKYTKLKNISDCGFGANSFGDLNWFGALLVEILLTFVFVLVILAVTESKDEGTRKHAPIFIGIALTFVHLLGINLTGTSVNPARSIGPALFAIGKTDWSSLTQLWVFIVGPLVGAFIAALVNSVLIRKK